MENLVNTLLPNFERLSEEFYSSLLDTLIMVLVSGTIAWVLGVVIGVLLVVCKKGGILENRFVYIFFDRAIDVLRAIPFIILMVLLIPLSRAIVGTGSGLTGSFVAFFSRQIESVLSHLDSGLIEASKAMGLRPLEIIFGVYLRESIPGITRVTMITFVSFIGITAIAGAIGAGGIGDFAIRYGYQMGYRDMIWLVVAVVLLIISIVQGIGKLIIKKTTF